MMAELKDTLVIGLGNPILGDDGAGWRVAEEVARQIDGKVGISVECFALGGLSLMEHMEGYRTVILIDTIFTGTKPTGTINIVPLGELPDLSAGHTTAAHDTSLRNALIIGRKMDLTLPEDKDITVVSIEAESVYDFSETLTPPVEAAIPLAVEAALKLINN